MGPFKARLEFKVAGSPIPALAEFMFSSQIVFLTSMRGATVVGYLLTVRNKG